MAAASARTIDPGSRRYIAAAMRAPMLEREQETDLARRWRDDADEAALHSLVNAYARFVVRIAAKFRGYGLPIADLVQQGNVGLMQAAARFDPERGVRFSTYASWWIRAALQDHILRNSSIVRIATTAAQKSLFFNLRKLRARFAASGDGGLMSDHERARIAAHLGVPVAAVERMEAHLAQPDRSLNATVGGVGAAEDGDSFMDFLADDAPSPEDNVRRDHDGRRRNEGVARALRALTPRERTVIESRFLRAERKTLAEIGAQFGLTKERIRQIEGKALDKMRDVLAAEFDEPRDLMTA